jgi:hypothetical protein
MRRLCDYESDDQREYYLTAAQSWLLDVLRIASSMFAE